MTVDTVSANTVFLHEGELYIKLAAAVHVLSGKVGLFNPHVMVVPVNATMFVYKMPKEGDNHETN